MSWILTIWVAGTLLALCWGQKAEHEGMKLCPTGFHLCIHNKTRVVSSLVVHTMPYTVTKPCGGWLLSMTCAVTLYKMTHQIEHRAVEEQVTRCCDGYEQVGPFCALPVNRSDEFTAKPGSCPTADGPSPKSEDCEFDLDCPGWQKCCQRSGGFLCTHPARSENDLGSRGHHWNVTVTVKADYDELTSEEFGFLNLSRVLQTMVSGALQTEVSLFYLSSWPVHPYRTATSLLIKHNFTLSLFNATSKLQLLLKRIPEVTSVTVQDVDECAHPALRQCSPHADCDNTLGSYQCLCRHGYLDVEPSNPGVHCAGDSGNATDRPLTHLNTSLPPANSSMGVFTSTESSVTPALSNTSSVTHDLPHALLGTSPAARTSMGSAADTPLPAATCPPPSIRSLRSANVTGTSISVLWSSQFRNNQTFQVTLSEGSEIVHFWEIPGTTVEMRGLQPGVLYNVTVTPCACGQRGVTLHMLVKTEAETLDVTTRLTNIQFTADLRNTSSQAYKNLTESFLEEIYWSLSPEIKAMVDSGQVRIEIRGFSLGSVVVNFTIIFSQSAGQTISNVSTALVNSLVNSMKYTVDTNNTSINDFDECTSGNNDCSPRATCTNTWASYTCVCLDGFIDYNPQRPGRSCQANVSLDATPAMFSTTRTTHAPSVAQSTISTAHTTTSTLSSTATAAAGFTVQTTTTNQTAAVSIPTNSSTTQTTPSPSTTDITVLTIHSTPPTPTPRTFIPTVNVTTPTTATSPTRITGSMTASSSPEISSVAPTNTTAAAFTAATQTTFSTTLNGITSVLRSAIDPPMPGALSVQCRVASITVTVARAFLLNTNIQESALYLGMLGCGVNQSNATHVQLTVAWDECATRLVHNETFYTASVTLFSSMDPYTLLNGTVEVPKIQLEVPIMCSFMKSMLISADFGSMGYDMIKDVISGLGSFPVTVQLMNGTAPLPHNYSLSPEQALVVEVNLNTTSEQIKVIINKCWATPTQNPAATYSFTFLDNSCSTNMYTTVLMNGNSSTSRVSVQIFSLVNLNVIYLHCQVHICVQIGSDTCVPNCLQRAARSGNTVGTAFGSSGPVLRLNEESLEEKLNTLNVVGLACLGVGLSLFFIFGFFCLFYYQRNRIGHYNFNVKPKQENFTYLAFNT